MKLELCTYTVHVILNACKRVYFKLKLLIKSVGDKKEQDSSTRLLTQHKFFMYHDLQNTDLFYILIKTLFQSSCDRKSLASAGSPTYSAHDSTTFLQKVFSTKDVAETDNDFLFNNQTSSQQRIKTGKQEPFPVCLIIYIAY